MTTQSPQADNDPLCETCGYNLTGLNDDGGYTGVCPECGKTFDLQKQSAEKYWLEHLAGRWQLRFLIASTICGLVTSSGIVFESKKQMYPILVLVSFVILIAIGIRTCIAETNTGCGRLRHHNRAKWIAAMIAHAVIFTIIGTIIFTFMIAIGNVLKHFV